MDNNALRDNTSDNIAIATKPIKQGDAIIIEGEKLFVAVQDIEPRHKIALHEIDTGATIIRYGKPVGQATTNIHEGEEVQESNTLPVANKRRQ